MVDRVSEWLESEYILEVQVPKHLMSTYHTWYEICWIVQSGRGVEE